MNNAETTQWIKDNAKLISYAVGKFGVKRFKDEAFDELYNQAVLAIYRAGKTFNPNKNKASTYMITVIRRELTRYQRKNMAKLTYPIRYYDYNKYQDIVKSEDFIGMSSAVENIIMDRCNKKYLTDSEKFDNEIDTGRYFNGVVEPAYNSLTKNQQKIIDELYYIKDKKPNRKSNISFAKVASKLGYSSSYVGQVETIFISRVKRKMKYNKIEQLC